MSRHSRFVRLATGLVPGALALFACPATSHASVIYALTEDNILVEIDSAAPEQVVDLFPVLDATDDRVWTIDVRPSTGYIVAMTDDRELTKTYPHPLRFGGPTMNTLPAFFGSAFGFDFDPVRDQSRIVNDNDLNFETTVDSPFLHVVEGPKLNPSTANIVGIAYSNNYVGATTTTLYGIDSLTDQLVTINPETGLVTPVADLTFRGRIDITNQVGFDIAWEDGRDVAYAALQETSSAVSGLYRIDLATGKLDFLGQIGGGMIVRDIAILVPEPASLALLASAASLLLSRRRHRPAGER